MKKLYILAVLLCSFFAYSFPVFANEELIIGGDSIGIQVGYDGVLITGTYTITIDNELYDPGTVLQQGDIIKEVDGKKIQNLSELYEAINSYQNPSNEIPIRIERKGNIVDVTLKTVYDSSTSTYKSGLYVKDKIMGVGTLTYYNPTNQTYGALGHEIIDTDLKQIAQIYEGTIYPSSVTSITKAQESIAGEKHATIDFSTEIGNIMKNTNIGIYGHFYDAPSQNLKMEWANKEEVQEGPATIYTTLQDSQIEEFHIQITKVHKQQQSSVKGIEFEIVDEALLAKTNGIIQGMSGSPIVQNNKIIGAVTHVITSKPSTGYGVFIEWMLQESDSIE